MKKLLLILSILMCQSTFAMEECKESLEQSYLESLSDETDLERDYLLSLPPVPAQYYNEPISAQTIDQNISSADIKVHLNKILVGDDLKSAEEFIAALDTKIEIKEIQSVNLAFENKFLIVKTMYKVYIIELETAETIHIIKHKDDINHVALKLDCKYIVTASYDGYAKIYNLETKKEDIIEHHGRVISVKFSSDNNFVFIHSEDRRSTICYLSDEGVLSYSHEYEYKVIEAKITSDNKYIITLCLDGAINIYDINLKQNFEIEKGNEDQLISFNINYNAELIDISYRIRLNITPNNKFLITTNKKQINIFDIENKTKYDSLYSNMDNAPIQILDDKYFLICDAPAGKFYDIQKKQQVFETHRNSKFCKFIIKEGINKIIINMGNSILIKDLQTQEEIILPQDINIKLFEISPNHKYLILFLQNKILKIYDLENNYDLEHNSTIFTKDFNPLQIQNQVVNNEDNAMFGDMFQEENQPAAPVANPINNFFGLNNNNDDDNADLLNLWGALHGNNSSESPIIFSENSKYAVINCFKKLIVIDLENQFELLTTDLNTNQLILLIQPQSNELIIGHKVSGKIEIYNPETRTTIIMQEFPGDRLQNLIIHNNKYLVASYRNQNVVYDLNKKELLDILIKDNQANDPRNNNILHSDKYVISKDLNDIKIHRLDKSVLHKLSPIQTKLITWLHTQNSIDKLRTEEQQHNTIMLNKAQLKVFNSLPKYCQSALLYKYNLKFSIKG